MSLTELSAAGVLRLLYCSGSFIVAMLSALFCGAGVEAIQARLA